MATEVQEPERPCVLTEEEPPTRSKVFVGLLATLTGAAAAAIVVFVLRTYATPGPNAGTLLTTVALVAPIAWFFLESGVRLLVDKSSDVGSVLATFSWAALCLWCAAAALWILYLGIQASEPAGFLGAGVYGTAAWFCGKRLLVLKAKEAERAAV